MSFFTKVRNAVESVAAPAVAAVSVGVPLPIQVTKPAVDAIKPVVYPVADTLARVALAPVTGGLSLAQNTKQAEVIAGADVAALGVAAAPGLVTTGLSKVGGAAAAAGAAAIGRKFWSGPVKPPAAPMPTQATPNPPMSPGAPMSSTQTDVNPAVRPSRGAAPAASTGSAPSISDSPWFKVMLAAIPVVAIVLSR